MSDPQGPPDALRHALPGKRAEELPCLGPVGGGPSGDGGTARASMARHAVRVCAVVMHRARDFREEVNRVTAAGAAAEEEGEEEVVAVIAASDDAAGSESVGLFGRGHVTLP